MDRFDTELFIDEVEKRPALWDIQCAEYSNKIIRNGAWQELVEIFGENEDSLEKRENPLNGSNLVTAAASGHTDTMSNITLDNTTNIEDLDVGGDPSELEDFFWIAGLILSTLCLILQLVIFILKPNTRKIDQKILSQLTVARLVNSVLEYMVTYSLFHPYTKDLTFALYLQTDIVLVSWMFLYTKNLYEKVVLVFALQKWNFTLLSLLIWIVTIPAGVLCPVSIVFDFFMEFYQTYSWLKFIVLTLNVLFFGRIFYVIITRNNKTTRNFSEIIKTCVISFILVCLTSLQVFVNDILSYLEVVEATNIYCVINSYQAIAATIIFLILAKNRL